MSITHLPWGADGKGCLMEYPYRAQTLIRSRSQLLVFGPLYGAMVPLRMVKIRVRGYLYLHQFRHPAEALRNVYRLRKGLLKGKHLWRGAP